MKKCDYWMGKSSTCDETHQTLRSTKRPKTRFPQDSQQAVLSPRGPRTMYPRRTQPRGLLVCQACSGVRPWWVRRLPRGWPTLPVCIIQEITTHPPHSCSEDLKREIKKQVKHTKLEQIIFCSRYHNGTDSKFFQRTQQKNQERKRTERWIENVTPRGVFFVSDEILFVTPLAAVRANLTWHFVKYVEPHSTRKVFRRQLRDDRHQIYSRITTRP